MAYCKIYLHARLLDSDLPEDELPARRPRALLPAAACRSRSPDLMRHHRLRREIIATVVANQLVDRAGTTFAFRLARRPARRRPSWRGAYAVAREVFEMRSFWDAWRRSITRSTPRSSSTMLIEARKLVERSTRWLVRAGPHPIDIAATARASRRA